jgi:hypothetical protein
VRAAVDLAAKFTAEGAFTERKCPFKRALGGGASAAAKLSRGQLGNRDALSWPAAECECAAL